MLSILIPVYNYNIVDLVSELHRQAEEASISFEIIVMDDYSSELLRDQNKDVNKLSRVQFIELEKNIGRSRIRNKLASLASHSTLLFMDCDSEIADDKFIQRYLPYCGREIVVCGGRSYYSEPPEEPEYFLRWLYGISREQISAETRNKNPYRSFMTNNFIISKALFMQVLFDESIEKYGHEDTLFGLSLKDKQIPILHIDNALIHTGLEAAGEYLLKTGHGIENLVKLVNSGKIQKRHFQDVKILRYYTLLEKYKLSRVFSFIFDGLHNALYNNMSGSNPSLFLFDMYKLTLFCRAINCSSRDKVML